MESNALTVIHKLVRHEIYAVSNRLAAAGDSDDRALLKAIRRAAGMLRGHAEQEDARLLPALQAAAPELARRLDEQHESLDRDMDAICAAAEALQRLPMSRRVRARQQLHDAWNRFHRSRASFVSGATAMSSLLKGTLRIMVTANVPSRNNSVPANR